VSTGKTIALFLLGFFFVLMAFPVAWAVSAALGYLLAGAALAIGIYMAVKRGGRALPLVLGVVLAVFAVVILAGTAAVHLTAYTLSKTVEEIGKEGGTVAVLNTTATMPAATTSKTTNAGVVEASLGQTIAAGDWRVTATEVVETKYIKYGESYYGAPEGMKVILVKLRIKNAGLDVKTPGVEISTPVLVTSANKSYGTTYPAALEWILQPTKEVVEGAVAYTGLDLWSSIAPGTYTEGYLMYLIPEGEKAEKLYLTYWPNPFAEKTTISINLVK